MIDLFIHNLFLQPFERKTQVTKVTKVDLPVASDSRWSSCSSLQGSGVQHATLDI